MSLLSRIKRVFSGEPSVPPSSHELDQGHAHDNEPMSRHDRREAGRERHRETGEPAWEASDRIEDPAGSGAKNPDSAPEILGGG